MTEENGTGPVLLLSFLGERVNTKLHEWHLRAKARMADFGGWDMPIQYPSGPREEHVKVRTAAGLFDIDHMGRIEVTGRDALAFLQGIQTWDLARLAVGSAHYALLLNEGGGILDDIFVYRLPTSWLVVVNAANTAADRAWIDSHRGTHQVSLRDCGADTCMVALQGPAARSILAPLCSGLDLGAFAHHSVAECAVSGAPAVVCSTGYTGEPGYEILLAAADCETRWSRLLQAGAARGLVPCGLAARDSLRAEACLPLYGHEMDSTIDPFSAGLAKAGVSMDGHEFVGKAALKRLAAGQPTKLVGFEMVEPGVPRNGYAIVGARGKDAGRSIGRVTTGLFSPSTGRYVGMGYVESSLASIGQEIQIIIRDTPKRATLVRRPFYRSPHWR